jgi:uncharacterized protein (TIGR03067 family)
MQLARLILLVVAALFAAAGTGKALQQQKANLDGVWSVAELTEAGTRAPDAKAQSLRIEFKGDAITITLKDKLAIKGTVTVDSKSTPSTMDIRYEKDGKTITIPAVYELTGDDLKLCHPSAEGGARPSAIEATAKTVLLTLKRKK